MTDYRALLSGRSAVILYRQTEKNVCPGCAAAAWHVGRFSAECAHCGFAIPLVSPVAPATIMQENG